MKEHPRERRAILRGVRSFDFQGQRLIQLFYADAANPNGHIQETKVVESILRGNPRPGDYIVLHGSATAVTKVERIEKPAPVLMLNGNGHTNGHAVHANGNGSGNGNGNGKSHANGNGSTNGKKKLSV